MLKTFPARPMAASYSSRSAPVASSTSIRRRCGMAATLHAAPAQDLEQGDDERDHEDQPEQAVDGEAAGDGEDDEDDHDDPEQRHGRPFVGVERAFPRSGSFMRKKDS